MNEPFFSWKGTGKSAKLIFSGEPDSTLTSPDYEEPSDSTDQLNN